MMTTRRDFMGFAALAAALPAVGAEEKKGATGLPAWADAKIDEAVARFLKWKGADEVASFVFITDVHSKLTQKADPPDFGNSRYHVLFAQAAADRAGCDFIVDGGDHDYQNGCKSAAESLQRMAVAESVYHDYKARPVLFCLGNHDHGLADDRKSPAPISSQLFGDTFNGLAEKHGFKLVFGENRSWGYYDAAKSKFRAIFCNTSDEGYYGFSQSQVDFVAQALETLPDGWSAAAFGHFCVFNEIGHWKQYQGDCAKRKQEFMSTLEKFSKARPNALVGYFCGDSHFDNEMELRGVNWTISQGYGGVDRANLPWGARFQPFSRGQNMLFEIVGVKPQKGEFRLFRVGAGGEASDRICSYFSKYEKK